MPKKPAKGPPGYTRSGLTSARIREVLADGDWHTVSWIVSRLSPEVNPEGALRKARSMGYRSGEIAKAKRIMIVSRLYAMARNKDRRPQLETRTEGEEREFRIHPDYRRKSTLSVDNPGN